MIVEPEEEDPSPPSCAWERIDDVEQLPNVFTFGEQFCYLLIRRGYDESNNTVWGILRQTCYCQRFI